MNKEQKEFIDRSTKNLQSDLSEIEATVKQTGKILNKMNQDIDEILRILRKGKHQWISKKNYYDSY